MAALLVFKISNNLTKNLSQMLKPIKTNLREKNIDQLGLGLHISFNLSLQTQQ
jgi:hypothetical protein